MAFGGARGLSITKGSGGYILLYRKLLDHPLVHQLSAAWFRVFIVILLKVNWKPGIWWDGTKEVIVPAGSLITSVDKLRRNSRVSVKQVRGCLAYLKTANIAAIETAKQYTLITLLNWDTYQNPEAPEGKVDGNQKGELGANEGQTKGKPGATIESGNQGSRESGKPEEQTTRTAHPLSQKARKPASGGGVRSQKSPKPKPHTLLREAMAQYMTLPGEEKVYPDDRQVTETFDAGHGHTEADIVGVLKYFYNERGLLPGTRGGPRHFGWFPVIVNDRYTHLEERAENANPSGFDDWSERNEAKAAKIADGAF